MKKILYLITQSERGGAQTYVKDLAVVLKDDYSIIVAAGEESKENWLRTELDKYYVPFVCLKHLKRAISPINDYLALLEIIKLIKKEEPDVIHLNSSKISILGSLAWRLLPKISRNKTKIVFTVHGWVFLEPQPFLKQKFFLLAEKHTARYKHKLICVSENDRLAALKERICPESKLITIHNGLSMSEQSELQNHGQIDIPAPTSGTRIITIANLYPTKGLEFLIRSARILADKNFAFSISIIGEGGEKSKLEALIKSLGLQDKVFLLGAIPQASLLLSSFDLYVCSSVKEGLSYTVIEAMLSGLPIAATNVGGNGELITDKKEGLLVEAKNPTALAAALEFLITHHDEAKIFGQSARKKAESDFSLEQMVLNTKKAYKDL